ncbi:MAG TPA: nucleotidyltransferase domain-containing protein [Prolixibacteraceae bacterium]|nr:nucleotidyltransferase domain-containing protein [Prolixibacteraceae bacterium]
MVTRESAIKTARLFIKDCQANGLTFHKVFLFGSAAKQMTHEWSDIDLLLFSDQFGDNVFDNLKLYAKINIKYPVIETHPYPTRFYYQGDDFLNEIRKGSIEIIPTPN